MFTFEKFHENHLPLLRQWLRAKHVQDFWQETDDDKKLKEKFLDELPRRGVHAFVILQEHTPVGFIQYYDATTVGGGWWESEAAGTYGIDLMIGSAELLGRGLGPRIIREFIAFASAKESSLRSVITDPDPANARAIRAFEKAGFIRESEITTPSGRALLMRLNLQPRNLVFDNFATEYDLYRPKYPVALAQDIARRIGLAPNARLLEIGCGSGQATAAFAKLGCEIEALDPSESLIAIARQNLSAQKQIRFHCQKFEDYESPKTEFDFIYSANAFHWVRPEVGWKKAANLLKPDGHFAILTIKRELEPNVRAQLDDLYLKYKQDFSAVDTKNPIPNPQTPANFEQEYFTQEEKITQDFEITYDADAYIGLMKTMSDHQLLPSEVRDRFFSELRILCERIGNIKAKNITSAQLYRKKANC